MALSLLLNMRLCEISEIRSKYRTSLGAWMIHPDNLTAIDIIHKPDHNHQTSRNPHDRLFWPLSSHLSLPTKHVHKPLQTHPIVRTLETSPQLWSSQAYSYTHSHLSNIHQANFRITQQYLLGVDEEMLTKMCGHRDVPPFWVSTLLVPRWSSQSATHSNLLSFIHQPPPLPFFIHRPQPLPFFIPWPRPPSLIQQPRSWSLLRIRSKIHYRFK